jgi:hypothetical protein
VPPDKRPESDASFDSVWQAAVDFSSDGHAPATSAEHIFWSPTLWKLAGIFEQVIVWRLSMIDRLSSDDLCRAVRVLAEERNELERLRYKVRMTEAKLNVSKRNCQPPFGEDSRLRKSRSGRHARVCLAARSRSRRYSVSRLSTATSQDGTIEGASTCSSSSKRRSTAANRADGS